MKLLNGSYSENINAIRTYLESSLIDHSNQTFYNDIYSLDPGNLLIFDRQAKTLKKECWYNLVDNISSSYSSDYRTCYSESLDLISETIKLYCRSDVPIGINLSGGLDSSLLTFLASKTDLNLSLFTISYEEPYDEAPFANRLSHLGNIYTSKINFNYFYSNITNTIESQDQPFSGLPVIGYGKLYDDCVDKGTKVVLDGNGIDECFLGYTKYIHPNISEHRSIDGTSATFSGICSRDLLNSSSHIPIRNSHSNTSNARQLAISDIISTKIPRSLRFNDHISMSRSVGLRVPFLDHKIVEYAFDIDQSFLIKEGKTKYLIREICSNLLDIPLNEGKRSVQTPQREYLSGKFLSFIDEEIIKKESNLHNWIDIEAFTHLINEAKINMPKNSNPLWQLIIYITGH